MVRKESMNFKRLFYSIVLISFSAVAQHSNELPGREISVGQDPGLSCDLLTVQKALALKSEVEQANEKDLLLGWEQLNKNLEANGMSWENLKTLTEAKILNDKNTLIEVKATLDAATKEERGTPELRTSLQKLLGTKSLTGIFDDALDALKKASSKDDLNPQTQKASHNKITVLKTLLIYMAHSTGNREQTACTLKNMQLVYPAAFPSNVSKDKIQDVVLCQDNNLNVPNAGYIFGGTTKDGKCKGIDCSTFVSICSDSKTRLTTMGIEYVWKSLTNFNFSEEDLKTKDELFNQWGFANAASEFEAISETAQPRPGDLITWRWKNASGSGRSGHTAIYLEPIKGKPDSFLGVEANREDDKTKEGIMISPFVLRRGAGVDLYILRRKR